MSLIPGLALVALLALAIVLALRHAGRRRRRAFARVLDAADAFEAQLRVARARLGQADGDPVREALQEMLRQRLWLQQQGDSADAAALEAMRASIEQARTRIDRQLAQLESATRGGA